MTQEVEVSHNSRTQEASNGHLVAKKIVWEIFNVWILDPIILGLNSSFAMEQLF